MENEKTDLTLIDRHQLSVTGVKKIKSSAPDQVVLQLATSTLLISGADLTLGDVSMQNGRVIISGLVQALKYTGNNVRRKFSWKNLFH